MQDNKNKITPIVSVVMAVYNGDQYLSESIESILNQSFWNFEFIIINDGSCDNSKQIIENYLNHDKRIRLLNNSCNRGLAYSLNRGINCARSGLIARQDADDISENNRLEHQINILELNPDIAVCGSWAYKIDEWGHKFSSYRCKNKDIKFCLNYIGSPFPHGSVMMQRKVFNREPMYNELFKYTQDRELWFRLFKKGYKIHITEDYLYNLRITRNNTVKYSNKKKMQGLYGSYLMKYYRKDSNTQEYNNGIKAIQQLSRQHVDVNNSEVLNQYLSFLIIESLYSKNKILAKYYFRQLKIKSIGIHKYIILRILSSMPYFIIILVKNIYRYIIIFRKMINMCL
jgi:glycosyltransferase involved in cell wall biosynthesis